VSENKKYTEDDTKFSGKYSASVLNTLQQAYAPYFINCFFLLITGFCGRVLLMSNANLIGYWVDSLCRAPSPCQPVPASFQNLSGSNYIALLASVTFLGLGLTLVFRIWFSRIGAYAVSQLYDEVTLRSSRLPMAFFDSTPVGRIVTRFSSDYGNVFRLFGGPLAEFIGIIFDLLAMLVLITAANKIYLGICLVIGLLNYAVYRFNRERLRLHRRELSRNRSPSISHFAETTQGASTIRAFQKQATFFLRFKKLNELFLNQKLITTRQLLSFSLQMNTLTAFLLLLTGMSAYFLVEKSILSIGSVGVAFSFIIISGNSLQMFFDWVAQFEEAMIGVERLDQYLRHPIEEFAKLPARAQFKTGHQQYLASEEALNSLDITSKISSAIEIRNLNFRYRPDLPWVLKNINLKINAGERLGIVGRTGSGKTSLIQVLFHLYPIDEGEVLIDQKAFIDLEQHRKSISLISQDPVIFKGTLRENLSLDKSKKESDLISVLHRVGLKLWLDGLSDGLQTQIDERGRNLSQGEKQLLCMARCLLQDSPIVIMDEATSNVDPHSEEILVRATSDFFAERTQIIIAHRLSTIEKCDRILWLHNGEIKMLGKPSEVLPEFREAHL
jgi:ABC-type multidrug transport system fused ATPase/permease subunit